MKRTSGAIAIFGHLLAAVVGTSCKDSPGPSSLTVTAVSPATGSMAGGTSVTINGTNFIDVTSVTIGGSELGSRMVVSATEITGTVPAATSPGAKDVVVTSSSQGSGTCSGCFTYESVTVVAATLAAGGLHTCALTSDGAAYCWGDGSFGQLGDRSTLPPSWRSATPVAVAGGLRFSALALGPSHTCGLTTSGAAYCWGFNYSGQLGDGSWKNRATPVAVSGGLSFSTLATGGSHTCGLATSGAAYCWGSNLSGQLGRDTFDYSTVPVAVAPFSASAPASTLLTPSVDQAGAAAAGSLRLEARVYEGPGLRPAVTSARPPRQ